MKLKFIANLLLGFTLANAKLVMVIRHGEKLNDKVTNLSEKGQARAECLIEAFGANGVYATPQKIYAQSPDEKKQSTRPRDTVVPLAKSLGLEVDLSFTSNKVKKLVKDIENSSEEVYLISWSNDKIDDIADKFDIKKAPKWDGDVFDDIWVITDGTIPYVKQPGVNVTVSSSYKGKGDMSMVIVKENVDDCINRLIYAVNHSNAIQNTQVANQNAQYSDVQQQQQQQQQAATSSASTSNTYNPNASSSGYDTTGTSSTATNQPLQDNSIQTDLNSNPSTSEPIDGDDVAINNNIITSDSRTLTSNLLSLTGLLCGLLFLIY